MSCNLALNVYSWGEEASGRLLVELLGPTLEKLYAEGLLTRFLFDRFDARGPHVFVLLAAAEMNHLQEIEARLSERLACFLASHPSDVRISEEQLLFLHDACRGKALCAIDHREGIAPNNSFAFAPHEDSAYPFWLWRGQRENREFWGTFTEQSLWAIGQVSARPGKPAMGAALRWIASVDRTLHGFGVELAERYWRYHVGTLLPAIPERLEHSTAARVAASLEPLIKAGNLEIFDRFWAAATTVEGQDFRASRLTTCILEGEDPDRRLPALREVVHISLKQLGLILAYQISIVIYAWQRSIRGEQQG